MDDFSDASIIEGIINEYLEKSGYQFIDDNPDKNNFLFYYSLKFEEHDISLFVGITKETPFRVDIVSAVNFSPEHISVLKTNPDNINEKMKSTIFMWLTPREPQFLLNLYEKEDFENSSYIIITPIYEGELTFASLMRSIDKTISASLLTRKIIQDTLNPHIKESKD